MAYSPNIHVAIYQLLDEAIRANVAPRGAKATIHSIIDDLHACSAPRQMIDQAENISLQLHRLEGAVIQGDRSQASQARKQLRSIAAKWLNYRICNA